MRVLRLLVTALAAVSFLLLGLSLAWWQRSQSRMDAVVYRPQASGEVIELVQMTGAHGKWLFSHVTLSRDASRGASARLFTAHTAVIDPISPDVPGYPAFGWPAFTWRVSPVKCGNQSGHELVVVLPIWPAPIVFAITPVGWFFWCRRRIQAPYEPAVSGDDPFAYAPAAFRGGR
jgi:hypothetical protein